MRKGKSQTGSKESKAPTLKPIFKKDQTTFLDHLFCNVPSLRISLHDPTAHPSRPRIGLRPLQARRSPRNHFLRRSAAPRGTATGRPKVFGANYVEAHWACDKMRVVGRLIAVGARY